MSYVVGIDVSTKAVDLVRLDAESSDCTWDWLLLGDASTALERLRSVPRVMPWGSAWWDDVYLVAIEAPMSRGQPGSLAKLSRVFGAVVAMVPLKLELWEITPQEWRRALELPGNAPKSACAAACVARGANPDWVDQNAYDAWAVAYTARELNQRGVPAAHA